MTVDILILLFMYFLIYDIDLYLLYCSKYLAKGVLYKQVMLLKRIIPEYVSFIWLKALKGILLLLPCCLLHQVFSLHSHTLWLEPWLVEVSSVFIMTTSVAFGQGVVTLIKLSLHLSTSNFFLDPDERQIPSGDEDRSARGCVVNWNDARCNSSNFKIQKLK